MTNHLLPLILAIALPASGAAAAPTDMFECRSGTGDPTGFPVLRSGQGPYFAHWRYDPGGQRIFDLQALFMAYHRSERSSLRSYHYVSVVRGAVDQVRRLLEAANPDLRCFPDQTPNGVSYTCLAADRDRADAAMRSISIFRPAGDSSLGDLDEGVAVQCVWEESLHRAPAATGGRAPRSAARSG